MKKEYNPAKKIFEATLTEEHVVRLIMDGLAYNRIKVWRVRERIPWGKTKSTPGIPDLFGYVNLDEFLGKEKLEKGDLNPRSVFIEVKKPGGNRRPAQIAFIQETKADGCISFFAESWNDVVNEFEQYGIKLSGE